MFRTLLALLLISTPALADTPLTCDIELNFGSTGVGIDAKVYENIMRKVNETPSITERHIENLGQQGERTLCLKVTPADINTVYADLKTLIPEEGNKTWTEIKSKNGQQFKTRQTPGLVRTPWK